MFKLIKDAPMWFKPFVIPLLIIANMLGFIVGTIIIYLVIFQHFIKIG